MLAAEVDFRRQFDSRAMAAAEAAPGRLKREPEASQGVGAWGAGVIYLIGFNKSGRSTQGRGWRSGGGGVYHTGPLTN